MREYKTIVNYAISATPCWLANAEQIVETFRCVQTEAAMERVSGYEWETGKLSTTGIPLTDAKVLTSKPFVHAEDFLSPFQMVI